MAIDNTTLAQLLGGTGTTSSTGTGSPYGALGMLGNYLLQQGQARPATTAVPAQVQPVMMGGGMRTGGLGALGGGAAGGAVAAGTNPYQSANPYPANTGTSATSTLGVDPLVAALLRAKLARSMGSMGSGGGGLGL